MNHLFAAETHVCEIRQASKIWPKVSADSITASCSAAHDPNFYCLLREDWQLKQFSPKCHLVLYLHKKVQIFKTCGILTRHILAPKRFIVTVSKTFSLVVYETSFCS